MDSFDIQRTGTEVRIAVRRSLDINSAPALSDHIDVMIGERPTKVTVDLAALDLIDSSGVAALVKLYKAVRNIGSQMQVVGTRDQPLAIFKLLRMDKVFGIA